MPLQHADDYSYLFKLVLVGDSGVGKTSLVLRCTDQTFTADHIATIAVDFKMKTLDMGSDGFVKLQIWDTAGQDRFRATVGSYYVHRGSHGLIVVYDVTDMESFEHVKTWFQDADHHSVQGKLLSRLLVGNKTDQEARRVVPFDTAQALADAMGVPYIETSAKDNSNVEQAFTAMANTMLEDKKANPSLWDNPSGRLNVPVGHGGFYQKPFSCC